MAVQWDSRINQKVLRDGTSWEEPETVIEDTTRSGKQKRRLYASMTKRQFTVSFNFTLEEYGYFREWYTTYLRQGAFSFEFPQLDSDDNTQLKEYRIKKGGFPKYSNKSGKIIACSMTWEEV